MATSRQAIKRWEASMREQRTASKQTGAQASAKHPAQGAPRGAAAGAIAPIIHSSHMKSKADTLQKYLEHPKIRTALHLYSLDHVSDKHNNKKLAETTGLLFCKGGLS